MNTNAQNKPMTVEKSILQARDFLSQYYNDHVNHEKPKKPQSEREKEVIQQIREKKTYKMTSDELVWGARMAWRNAPRCPARVIWKKLTVFDKRHIDDAEGMFKAILEHLEYSNNGGNIRPAITVFRQREPGKKDPRVWNGLMCQFAAYEADDGSIIGDPAALGITQFCQKLGWQGKGTPFDFLPMLLSGADGEPKYFEIPEHLCMRVKITHPTNEGINSMGLEWFGLPGVSSMMFECGGLQYPGAPFAGWYQGTEVASRDFLDPQRYNLLVPIGEAMGLDMSSNTTLWKDEVALELNKAVLYSYKKAGVSIVDHFTQADQFMDHMKDEIKVRGGCPADWVWIVPPQGGSLTSTFHQEMLNYHLSPSYEYQDKPYETWYRGEKRKTFRAVAKTVFLWMSLYMKMVAKRKICTVFYSSETGTAKKFAKMAAELFNMSYKTQLMPLDRTPAQIRQVITKSDIELVVASTFGNGESPEMSRTYTQGLTDLVDAYVNKEPQVVKLLEYAKYKYYAVFGLGSSAYPKFAAYGRLLDSNYQKIGANPMIPYTTGDELKDQKGSFNKWLRKAFLTSLKIMNQEPPKAYLERIQAVKQYRWRSSPKGKVKTASTALSEFYDVAVNDFKMTKRSNLHKEAEEPPTLKIDFHYDEKSDITYAPGDHLSIYPCNDRAKVEYLKSRLNNNPPEERLVTLQVESGGLWENADDFPVETTFDDILTYFLDISQTPTQSLLNILAKFTEDKEEKEEITVLANDEDAYEKWRKDCKDVTETLREFVSINITSPILASQLGIIKPRKYSIASTPIQPISKGSAPVQALINNVSLVVGVAQYQTETGRAKKGLTTGMLQSLKNETSIFGSIKNAKSSNFRLPDDPAWPIIMICAGSGIAPFRGFWMKRFEQTQEGQMVGKTSLYFGCRKKSMNLLKNETDMLSNASKGLLGRLMSCNDGIATEFEFEREVAYSREPNHPKQYVQNLLTRDAAKIHDLWVKKGGYIYICGKISMAEGIEKALKGILRHIGNIDEEAVESTMEDMRKNMRYQEDIFG